jgi:hypothetical protein
MIISSSKIVSYYVVIPTALAAAVPSVSASRLNTVLFNDIEAGCGTLICQQPADNGNHIFPLADAAYVRDLVGDQQAADVNTLDMAKFTVCASVSVGAFAVALASAGLSFIGPVSDIASDFGLIAMIVAGGSGYFAARMAQSA